MRYAPVARHRERLALERHAGRRSPITVWSHVDPLRVEFEVVARIRDVQEVGHLRHGLAVECVGRLELGQQEVEVAVEHARS